jgi:hypothetical protein
MVAVKSIKSLFVATSGYDNVDEVEHQISSIGVKVKLIVAQEISLLWEPEEWLQLLFETTKTEALLNSVNSLEIYGLEKLMVTGRTS